MIQFCFHLRERFAIRRDLVFVAFIVVVVVIFQIWATTSVDLPKQRIVVVVSR